MYSTHDECHPRAARGLEGSAHSHALRQRQHPHQRPPLDRHARHHAQHVSREHGHSVPTPQRDGISGATLTSRAIPFSTIPSLAIPSRGIPSFAIAFLRIPAPAIPSGAIPFPTIPSPAIPRCALSWCSPSRGLLSAALPGGRWPLRHHHHRPCQDRNLPCRGGCCRCGLALGQAQLRKGRAHGGGRGGGQIPTNLIMRVGATASDEYMLGMASRESHDGSRMMEVA